MKLNLEIEKLEQRIAPGGISTNCDGGSKDDGSKDGSKDDGSKDCGSKDDGSKDGGSKDDCGSKDGGSKDDCGSKDDGSKDCNEKGNNGYGNGGDDPAPGGSGSTGHEKPEDVVR